MSAAVIPKFIDDSETVVDSAITALCECNPHVQRLANTNVVVATNADPSKVLILCGGGSGHEPAHPGMVARGWLSAAVCGSVFASPPTAHVSAAIEHLAGLQAGVKGSSGSTAGILVVIKNYAGDCLNFEFAVRQAREQGIRVESVLAADDAVFGTEDTGKRRGIAGTCLLYKILGAAAAKGISLAQLLWLAERVSANMRSIGASLSSCALPGCPPSSAFPSGTAHVEIGLGIHGEKGLVQMPYSKAGAGGVVRQLMDILLNTDTVTPASEQILTPETRDKVHPPPVGSKVLLLVNNLGSTTELEMSVVASHALRACVAAGYTVIGVNVGRHMTALDMHGFSLTVLAVADEGDVEFMLNTGAVQKGLMNFHTPTLDPRELPGPMTALQIAKKEAEARDGGSDASRSSSPLRAACEYVFSRLLTMEAEFNALDAAVGDGDLGSGVHRAATAGLALLPFLAWEQDVGRTFALLAKAVADACAGTSGPLYGALLLGGGSAAHSVMTAATTGGGGGSAADAVRAAIAGGSDDVQKLGGARKGDRTMVDVLEGLRESPAVAAAATVRELLPAALEAARAAAKATAQLPAKFGRSRYLGGKEVGQPDPGAELIVSWIEALVSMQ